MPTPQGTSERRDGDRYMLHFEPHLPFAYETVWPALTTPEGLRTWLADAQVLERRLGGAVTLRWIDEETTATGHVTAWDVERIAEYTVDDHDRIRFHLEPLGTDSTLVRFTDDRHGSDSDCAHCLEVWQARFDRLEAVLAESAV
ncbi:SRPBCC domain-containing protein [Streptomyces antimicrobicus]|uniref:SRPBCC domain-containing protein n=1 Tax=Streptomyces antimicrobicus TaxID=2883108 RepID=A0ABS8B2V0_9ACTN|nr:SRPBCC domain-containing protein [Streptomyces antimicrobicus]MCB5178945.1 SRPBCC domain-containing protein [Streptomyces antimicrobicus]